VRTPRALLDVLHGALAHQGEGLEYRLEPAVLRELADRGDQPRSTADPVYVAYVRTLGIELALIQRGRSEHGVRSPDGLGLSESVVDDTNGVAAPDQRPREWVGAKDASRMERANQLGWSVMHRNAGQPVVVRQVSVHDVEAMPFDQLLENSGGPQKRDGVLRSGNDGMGKVVVPELRVQLVAANVGEMRVDASLPQCLDLREGWRCGPGPAISGRQVENPHRARMVAQLKCYTSPR